VTLLRAVLAIPALLLAIALRVVLALAAIPAWFAALARGRTTAGLQELGTFCLRYELEAVAYALLLTARYPRLVPAESPAAPATDLPAAKRRPARGRRRRHTGSSRRRPPRPHGRPGSARPRDSRPVRHSRFRRGSRKSRLAT